MKAGEKIILMMFWRDLVFGLCTAKGKKMMVWRKWKLKCNNLLTVCLLQQTRALEKPLPEAWKLAIARKIENNLMSKVNLPCVTRIESSCKPKYSTTASLDSATEFLLVQIPFLSSLADMGEIRTLFSAEVSKLHNSLAVHNAILLNTHLEVGPPYSLLH